MSIGKLQLGENSKDIIEAVFHDGDIMMTRIQYKEGVYTLALCEHSKREIGETTQKYKDKSVDDFPSEIKICLSFTNPKSLNAIIQSLCELQMDALNGKLNK